METAKIAKVISYVIIAVSILVMLGWLFDIQALKSIHPEWVTMKFATALSFFISGIILRCILCSKVGNKTAEMVLSVATITLLIFIGPLLASALLGFEPIYGSSLFAEEGTLSSFPGMPSISTLLNFFLIFVAGLCILFRLNEKPLYLIAGFLGASGLIAIIGYAANVPFLYFSIKGISTAVALHTAALFMLWGIGLMLILQRERERVKQ